MLTVAAKYLFLDVVGFTKRSVEAQADVVAALNAAVSAAFSELKLSQDNSILLPTGDGICVALLNIDDPYDIHVLLSLSILRHISEHNKTAPDESRQFHVRIALNANIDNIVTDINNRRNIAGSGINTAARIMGLADADQVLVGPAVYEVLRAREKYLNAFRNYSATVKHGFHLAVYQLICEAPGLSIVVPKALAPRVTREPELSRTISWYIALAIRFREVLLEADDDEALLWLWYRACDAVEIENVPEHRRPTLYAHGVGVLSEAEQLKYYSDINFSVKYDLAGYLSNDRLRQHHACFDIGAFGRDWRFVTDHGKLKLQKEHPDLWVWATEEQGA